MTTTPAGLTTCTACGAKFTCGALAESPCWCMDLPPLLPVDTGTTCLCPTCLSARLEAASYSKA